MNICENLQRVQSQFLKFIFGQIQISIGLLVFGFIANEYKQRDIWLRSTIHYIQSTIR